MRPSFSLGPSFYYPKKKVYGTSLVHLPMQGASVPSLVGELRSHMQQKKSKYFLKKSNSVTHSIRVYVRGFSHVSLCPAMDCSLPGSSIHEILQARILEWVSIPSSMGSSWLRDWTQVSCIAGWFFTIWVTKKAQQIVHIKKKSIKKKLNIC